jgi:hypothetical protein
MAAPTARRIGTHIFPGPPREGAAQFRELPPSGRGELLGQCDQVRGQCGSGALTGARAADGARRQPSGPGAGELAR